MTIEFWFIIEMRDFFSSEIIEDFSIPMSQLETFCFPAPPGFRKGTLTFIEVLSD